MGASALAPTSHKSAKPNAIANLPVLTCQAKRNITREKGSLNITNLTCTLTVYLIIYFVFTYFTAYHLYKFGYNIFDHGEKFLWKKIDSWNSERHFPLYIREHCCSKMKIFIISRSFSISHKTCEKLSDLETLVVF